MRYYNEAYDGVFEFFNLASRAIEICDSEIELMKLNAECQSRRFQISQYCNVKAKELLRLKSELQERWLSVAYDVGQANIDSRACLRVGSARPVGLKVEAVAHVIDVVVGALSTMSTWSKYYALEDREAGEEDRQWVLNRVRGVPDLKILLLEVGWERDRTFARIEKQHSLVREMPVQASASATNGKPKTVEPEDETPVDTRRELSKEEVVPVMREFMRCMIRNGEPWPGKTKFLKRFHKKHIGGSEGTISNIKKNNKDIAKWMSEKPGSDLGCLREADFKESFIENIGEDDLEPVEPADIEKWIEGYVRQSPPEKQNEIRQAFNNMDYEEKVRLFRETGS